MFKTSRLYTEEEKRCQRGDEEGKTTRGVVQIVREEKADVKQRRRRWRRQIRDKRDDSRRGKTERGVFSEKTYRGGREGRKRASLRGITPSWLLLFKWILNILHVY